MTVAAFRRCVAVAAAVAFLTSVLPAHVAALSGPYQVLLVPDRLSFRTGEVANLTLYTFERGLLVLPASVAVTWGDTTVAWYVAMVLVAEGVYHGSFLVNFTAPGPFGIGLSVVAEVNFLDGGSDSAAIGLAVRPAHELTMQLTPSAYRIEPGGTLLLEVRLEEDGQPRDALNLAVWAGSLAIGNLYASDELPWSRVAVGVYEARYTVPATANFAWFALNADASTEDASAFGSTSVMVSQPHPFQIWVHSLPPRKGNVDVDIFVARDDGSTASGAAVDFNYSWGGAPMGPDRRELVGTTDSHGRAAFNLSVPTPLTSPTALLVGNATEGGQRSSFAAWVGATALEWSSPVLPFEVRRTNPWELVVPNETTVLHYAVLQSGQPLPNRCVDFYAWSPVSFQGSGSVCADANGTFALAVPAPLGTAQIAFAVDVSGVWEYGYDSLYPAFRLAAEIDALEPGHTSRGRGELPPGLGPWLLAYALVPLDESGLSPDIPWQRASTGLDFADDILTGPVFEFNLSFPRFLPKGREYLESVSATPEFISQLRYLPWQPSWQMRRLLVVPNSRPEVRASLSSADIVPGEVLRLNASASSDPDGWVDAYQVDWGDGDITNWIPDAVFDHAYRVSRDFVITLRIRDDSEGYNVTSLAVHVAPSLFGVRLALLIPLAGLLGAAAAIGVAWFVLTRKRTLLAPRTPLEGLSSRGRSLWKRPRPRSREPRPPTR